MMIQAQVSVQSQVFIPRDYHVFAGLNVDKHSIAATFCNHEGLLRSLRLPYSAPQLLNYARKHFPEQREREPETGARPAIVAIFNNQPSELWNVF